MTSYITLPFILFSILTVQVNEPIYLNDPFQKISPQSGVLQGRIEKTKELPKEFYGTWSASSKLVRTSNPILFRDQGSDIWLFEKKGNIITLTNPVSGATASITVNEVHGTTAVFTREKITNTLKEYEKANITVNGDSFSGTDTLIYEHYKNGKYVQTSFVEYEVKGTKISGPTLTDIFSQE